MVADSPTVSVVVPVHNAFNYLERTRRQLSSLKRSVQYEFIVIDDHSTDGSYEHVASWDDLPGPLTVLRANKRGVANARNQALLACSGEFVWMADADDEWTPSIVSSMADAAVSECADVVLCNATRRSPDGHPLGEILDAPDRDVSDGPEAFRRLLTGRIQGHLWNKLIRRELLTKNLFPDTRAHSDLGGLLSLLPEAKRVYYLPENHYVYLQNPSSILTAATYRPDDLLACLQVAENTCQRLESNLETPLIKFKYRIVVLPILSFLARPGEPGKTAASSMTQNLVRNKIAISELLVLATLARSPRAAALTLIGTFSPQAYHLLRRLRAPAL